MNDENMLDPTPAADTWRGKLHQLGFTYNYYEIVQLVGRREHWENTRDHLTCIVAITRYDDTPSSFTFTDQATNNSLAVDLDQLMRLEHVTGTRQKEHANVEYKRIG